MSRYFAKFALLVSLLAFGLPSYACECGTQAAPAMAVNAAAHVFQGRVISIQSRQSFLFHLTHPKVWFADPDPKAMYRSGYGVTVELEVTRAWKGDVGQTFTLVTGNGGGDCGLPFLLGQRYLVYTRKAVIPETDICTRSAQLDQAAADLAFLNAPGNGKQLAKPLN